MALFGNKKDESDLGDVSKALDLIEQRKNDKMKLHALITNYAYSDSPIVKTDLRIQIDRIIDKYF